MAIKLKKPVEILIGETIKIDEFSIIRTMDMPESGKVVAEVRLGDAKSGRGKTFVLWENTEESKDYDLIGDWTQKQAEDRILKLLK